MEKLNNNCAWSEMKSSHVVATYSTSSKCGDVHLSLNIIWKEHIFSLILETNSKILLDKVTIIRVIANMME